MLLRQQFKAVIYVLLALVCLLSFVTPPIALFTGLILALTIGVPFPAFNQKLSKYLLQASIVGLGFGMNVQESLSAGRDGIIFTVMSVLGVMFVGIMVGKWMKVPAITSYLVASGTAICGGSAIAAVGQVTKASESEMSVSLATIFILNAIALFLFPVLGNLIHLTEHQFGMWAAIAIHDTSSVVGAGASYGPEALKVATTVKLARALWIVPLSIFTAYYFKTKESKILIPWFIVMFIGAMILNTYAHLSVVLTSPVVVVAKKCLTLTLFFIGAGLSRSVLRSVGVRPLVLGIVLWFFIAVTSLIFIVEMY